MKPLIVILLGVILGLAGCSQENTDTVPDRKLKKDTLIPVKVEVIDTVPPNFDSLVFDPISVECFFHLGARTGGKIYFAETVDSVVATINQVLRNHAVHQSDIVFLIDNTSSMFDDIEAVKANVNKIIELLSTLPGIKVASATYGDKNVEGDQWYRRTDLSGDSEVALEFINSIQVNGGGDYPESAYDAVYRTVNELNWGSETKRMILLIGDAPSQEPPLSDHNRKETVDKCLSMRVKANIYPVLVGIGY